MFLDEKRKERFLADFMGMRLHDPTLFIYSILYTCQEIKSSPREIRVRGPQKEESILFSLTIENFREKCQQNSLPSGNSFRGNPVDHPVFPLFNPVETIARGKDLERALPVPWQGSASEGRWVKSKDSPGRSAPGERHFRTGLVCLSPPAARKSNPPGLPRCGRRRGRSAGKD